MSRLLEDLVGCTVPLQLAGLGGGIGTPPAIISGRIDEATSLTTLPFGVNFLAPRGGRRL